MPPQGGDSRGASKVDQQLPPQTIVDGNAAGSGAGGDNKPQPQMRRQPRKTSKFVRRYVAHVRRWRWCIIVTWAVLGLVGAFLAPQLFNSLSNKLAPVKGSRAAIATSVLQEHFPDSYLNEGIIVMVTSLDGKSVVRDSLKVTSATLQQAIAGWNATNPGVVRSFQSYYTILDAKLPAAAAQRMLAGPNNTIAIMQVTIGPPAHPQKHGNIDVAFVEWLSSKVESSAMPAHPGLSIRLTGAPVFWWLTQATSSKSLERVDTFVLPLALMVLATILGTPNLLVIPVINIAIGAVVSFAIMYPIAQVINVISFCPAVMSTCLIAMSIDYSLFLLSRFKEEIKKGSPMQRAVTTMMASAGHTITVSGSTLAVCFLGQLFFPLDLLRSLGIGSAIAVSMTLIVNLTLTPALLLSFPRFFTAFCEVRHVKQCLRCRCTCPTPAVTGVDDAHMYEPGASGAEPTAALLASGAANKLPQYNTDVSSKHVPDLDAEWRAENEAVRKSCWLRPARALHTWCGVVVIVLVLAAAIPCIMQLPHLKQTADPIEYTPRGTTATAAFVELEQYFSPGNMYPYTIVLTTNATTTSVMSESFFEAGHHILRRFAAEVPHVTVDDFESVLWVNGGPMKLLFVQWAEDPANPLYHTADGRLLRMLKQQSVGKGATALGVQLTMGMDPYGPDGQAWLETARGVADQLKAETGLGIYIARGATDSIDSVREVFRRLPFILIGVAVAVFALVAISFRSLVIPLRSVLTISLTVAWVYGLAIMVYQQGVLNWLGFAALSNHGNDGALCWMAPTLAFSVMIGLGLDYDIFLLSRTVENRDRGFGDSAAVIRGLVQTGGIITAAGLIMTLAFGGLLLSSQPALNQVALFYCATLIIDTFVIRVLVVPAIMGVLGRLNWWPRKVPKAMYDVLGSKLE